MSSTAPKRARFGRALAAAGRTAARIGWRAIRGVLVVLGAMVGPFAMPPPPPPPRPVPEQNDGGETEEER